MNAHLRQEPVIITQLVRMGGERLILRELSKLRTLSADDMQVIMANCDIALSKAAINHALHTERVVTTKSLRRILLEKKGNKMSLLKQVGYPLTGNNMIRMMFWTKGRFAADIAEYNRRMLELNAKFMDPSKDLDTEREIADDYPFTAMLLPALNGILINHLAFEAHIQVNHAGIALKRHYQKHSAVPESLDALKLNESIIDPFTGKRPAYIKTDISATIYSIGKNKKDDEGINKGKKDDITFRLELK